MLVDDRVLPSETDDLRAVKITGKPSVNFPRELRKEKNWRNRLSSVNEEAGRRIERSARRTHLIEELDEKFDLYIERDHQKANGECERESK